MQHRRNVTDAIECGKMKELKNKLIKEAKDTLEDATKK